MRSINSISKGDAGVLQRTKDDVCSESIAGDLTVVTTGYDLTFCQTVTFLMKPRCTACCITKGAGGKCHRKHTAQHLWRYMRSMQRLRKGKLHVLQRNRRENLSDDITGDLNAVTAGSMLRCINSLEF